jgi:deoxyadenosine/deoxycytidine kinase
MVKIFSIEGNIGSGKSTIIQRLKESGQKYIFLPEPVDEWNLIRDITGQTILEKFYKNKKDYSFSFQMMAYITRLSQLKKCIETAPEDSIIITERCLYTDRYVFAKMLYDAELMNFIEYTIYNRWFDEFIDFKLSALIYVQTTPDVCLNRTRIRNRKGEESISLKYLESCHEYHEEFTKEFSLSNNDKKLFIYNGNGVINLDQIIEFISNF